MSDLKENAFDEGTASHKMDLYSRAIAALGVDTMRNLSSLSCLVIGLRGVGVETAKNLILAGPKSVTVHDDGITQIADLGANFYLREEHVGKVPRAEACLKTLVELNPYCDVKIHTGELSDAFIQTFGAVLVCQTLPKKELFRINQLCRTRKLKDESGNVQIAPVAFLIAVTHGVTGHIFADFGSAHVVKDPDGEPLRTLVVDAWEEGGRITVAAKKHGFEEGQKIRFEDIEGAPCKDGQTNISALNGATGIKIKRIYQKYTHYKADGTKEERERQVFNMLQLDLSEAKTDQGKEIKLEELGPWKTGGIITEVIDPIVKEFRSLEASLVNPAHGWEQEMWGPPHPDQGAWEKGAGKHVHLQYVSVLEFEAKYGHFPRLHNTDDSDNLIKIFETLNEENKKVENGVTVESVDKRRLRTYSWYFATELTGYCAFLGGIVAQEVVKKFGKYTPIFQWMHSDHIQLVGNAVPADAVPQNTRYDNQISIFGKSFQQLLSNQRIFLVGCGALGCEYLKGLAMMGVSCGPKGKLWCTDMDRIEVSNLSRQFLFRAGHVGKPKSTIAASVAKQMNSNLNVEALEMKVWSETENFFDDNFWDNLDLCWNALDNVIARKYTDSKCLFHGKPLLESGTQGTKCNSEIIIPFKTKTYNDGEEQETEGIAMCTLQNFPYLPLHCIEWARSSFSGQFEKDPQSYNTFVKDKKKFFEQVDAAQGEEQLQMLETVHKLATIQTTKVGFEQCIRLAFDEFVTQHITRIKNLMHWFPKEYKAEGGGDFWTGHKRFPQVPDFDLENPLISGYLFTAANLYAFAFGIEQVKDLKNFLLFAKKCDLHYPKWEPPKGPAVKIDEDDDKKKNEEEKKETSNEAQQEKVNSLIEALKKLDTTKFVTLKENEFEKDDDGNFHIDFITACANARAWNYRIKDSTRQDVKITAGKIIAALATTTAMITGLVELEFYKLKLGLQYLYEDAFYNANFNLAVPTQFQYFQPESAIRHKKETKKDESNNETSTYVPYPDQWTTWDHLVVDKGSLTVQELVDIFPTLFWGVKVKLLFKFGNLQEGKLLFNGTQSLRNTAMDEKLLARPNVSENQKKMLTEQIRQAKEYNANVKKGRDSKVIDRYIELYGPLVSDKRYYVTLNGDFEDANGDVAVLPQIKFIFKH